MKTRESTKNGSGFEEVQARRFTELEDLAFKLLLERQKNLRTELDVIGRDLQILFMRMGISPNDQLQLDPKTGRYLAVHPISDPKGRLTAADAGVAKPEVVEPSSTAGR